MENVPSKQEGSYSPENVDEHFTSTNIPELLTPAMHSFLGGVGAEHHQPRMGEVTGKIFPIPERDANQHHDLKNGPDNADPVQRQDCSVLVSVGIFRGGHRNHHLSGVCDVACSLKERWEESSWV